MPHKTKTCLSNKGRKRRNKAHSKDLPSHLLVLPPPPRAHSPASNRP
ncbi:hypothetical protein NHP190003_00910 [Helicobacter sp. NHP19-003]|uniref:Uncharacterized protein n=1 Tax=Helicobacter gastrocanis TaxID=2849641 RepID=A0ABM7SGB0_9HELI|nr:hypothetical protein NHP190003_00910 [Helicobacter sp. NHP19-003]